MLTFLPGPIKGVLALLLHSLNTIFWCTPIFVLSLVKLLVPIPVVVKAITSLLNTIASNWISMNGWVHALTQNMSWQVEGLDALKEKDWYLILANHQSWADIFVLQRIFNHRIPFMKFFLKQELVWVPVIGLAWWALDFPFMKRFTKSYLAKHPEMKGKDMETTKKACEKFKHLPVSIMNFVEGTRFTLHKHQRQQSPFKHLLKPKAGGAGFVMTAMGEQLHKVLDVTIAYPQKERSFWDFLCGKITEVRVQVNTIELTPELIGDYENDSDYRIRFQAWLNQLWREKDARIEQMIAR